PQHVAAEDRTLAPRLRRAVPGCGTLLEELARDHADVDACIWVLLAHLAPLAEGRIVPRATFRASAQVLRSRLLPRMDREERELFPLCEALSLADRVAIARELALPAGAPVR
ncbi:MAG: hemerythrin domain-containing protein, partial [Myxococcota bacterium]